LSTDASEGEPSRLTGETSSRSGTRGAVDIACSTLIGGVEVEGRAAGLASLLVVAA
jgi:hypothetical protein